jgi:hypothetical protein
LTSAVSRLFELVVAADLYEDAIATSSALQDVFAQIQTHLADERQLGIESMELIGCLDTIIASSNSVDA